MCDSQALCFVNLVKKFYSRSEGEIYIQMEKEFCEHSKNYL